MSSAPQIEAATSGKNGALEEQPGPPKDGGAGKRREALEARDSGAPARRRAWGVSLGLFAASSALLIGFFWSEISAAVHIWSTSSTFGHGFLILPITLFLLYRQRRRLALLTPRAAPIALIPIVGLTFLWILADLANVMVAKQFAFVALWQATFLLIMGWQVTRASIFPLGFLYLAVPLGSEIIPVLQDITAQIVVHLLRFTGMPVFLDGYYIQIPSGSFLVAEACSGLRFLIVCIALGILIAHLFFRSWSRRLAFLGLCLVVPIIANGIRAYGIVMLAHLSDYRLAADVDHIIYGFIFLSVIILALIGLTALLRDRDESPFATPAAPQGSTVVPASGMAARLNPVSQAFLVAMALGIVFLAQSWVASAKAPPAAGLPIELQVPAAAPPWKALADRPATWQATFHNADAMLLQSYRRGEDQVDLHIGYYAYQREGAEAASEANKVVDSGSGWQVVERRPTTVRLAGTDHPIVRLLIRRGARTYLVWYWYRIGGEHTNSRVIGKWLEMKTLATGGERSAAVVALVTEVFNDVRPAQTLLGDFLGDAVSGDSLVIVSEEPSTRRGAALPQRSSPVQSAQSGGHQPDTHVAHRRESD